MRYAIISDIHANRQAFEAVLGDIDRSRIDIILCLGDIVGYGPSPVEVMDMVYEHVDVSILGNHDAVVCNKFSAAYFNTEAKEIIEWTRSSLREHDIEYFSSQAYMIDGDCFKCAHANFNHPDNFGYVLSLDEASQSFQSVEEDLLFIGHTHIAGAHILAKNKRMIWQDANDSPLIKIEKNKRYIINVGSVGVSRTEEFNSQYVIYDSEKKNIAFRTVEFDVHGFAKDVHNLGKQEIVDYFASFIGRLSLP